MRRLRLAGLLLFGVGTIILIYLGVQFFLLNAKYNSTNSGLELIGFLLGVFGVLLYRTQKEDKQEVRFQG